MKEVYDEANRTIAAQTTRVHFVHVLLTQKQFYDEYHVPQRRMLRDESVNERRGRDAVGLVDGNVDQEAT